MFKTQNCNHVTNLIYQCFTYDHIKCKKTSNFSIYSLDGFTLCFLSEIYLMND
jgi:hypothetical protein